MRRHHVFVTGMLLGLAIQMAIAGNPNRGIIGLNHVGISVADLDEAVTYYTKVMGFTEAFRIVDETGRPAMVYVQIGKNTFVELQAANAQRPPGINHFGVHVENMADATATFRERGADVSDTRVGSTKAILSNISAPNGIRIELLELPAESLTAQAISRWQ